MLGRIAARGVAAVLAFDLFASVAARVFDFPYARASIGSYLLYLTIGVLTARAISSHRVRSAAIAAAVAGFADASLGWAISWYVGPGKLPPDHSMTAALWFTTAVFVVVLAAAVGAIGGLIGRRMQPVGVAVP